MSEKKNVTNWSMEVPVKAEIRGYKVVSEVFRDKLTGGERKSEYVRVVTDLIPSGDRAIWHDRDLSHGTDEYYKRGAVGALVVRLDIQEGYGCKAKVQLVGFEVA